LYKVTAADLREWNEIEGSKIIAGKTLKIYSDQIPTTSSNTGSQKNELNSESITHQIQAGETIIGISDLYGVSVEEIKRWNNLSSSKIVAGKSLIIYSNGNGHNKVSNNNITENNAGQSNLHKVKRGETLGGIAIKYNVSISSLQKLNNISGNKIIVGQELKIPGSNDSSISSKDGYHIVESGETLYSIANKYKTSVQKIKTLNNLSNSKIIVGQKLKIG
jgi:LysM repeat protein